jgi:hypothetical protein
MKPLKKLPPLAGLITGLALTVGLTHPASAQLFATWTPSVIVGGSTGAKFLATSAGNFVVTVRQPTGAPAPGVLVELDYSPVPTSRIIDTQNPGTTVTCPLRVLSKVTDVNGVAAFNPRLTGWDNGPQVMLRVAGVVVTTLATRSTAMDIGSPATSLSAFSLFASRYGFVFPEADFDVSGGVVGLGDFAIFSSEYTKPQPAQGICP